MQKNNNELFTTMPVGKARGQAGHPHGDQPDRGHFIHLLDTFFVGQIGDSQSAGGLVHHLPHLHPAHRRGQPVSASAPTA